MVIKTSWEVPALWFGYERYSVEDDGTVVGLSTDHRHFEAMVHIFDLTIEESTAPVEEEVNDNG